MTTYFLTAINGAYTNQELTVSQIESHGYTTRLRRGVLCVFHNGSVIAKGYESKVDQVAAL